MTIWHPCLRAENFRFSKNIARRMILAVAALLGLCTWELSTLAGEPSQFPSGFDAVEAAPKSHRVIFENALVRVLEVTIPPAGTTEPMHHHRWPGFFVSWDAGGRTPHIRYHRPDGTVKDVPSQESPVVAGHWAIEWMAPEPTHAIEVVESGTNPAGIPLLRVEIKIPHCQSTNADP